jgi:hypothetical protein
MRLFFEGSQKHKDRGINTCLQTAESTLLNTLGV